MVPILANVHGAALAYAEDTHMRCSCLPQQGAWLAHGFLHLDQPGCSQCRQGENCRESRRPSTLWTPLFLHRGVFVRDWLSHESLKVPCSRGQGLTDMSCAGPISPFHGGASLHNHGFFVSLQAPNQPQPVTHFGHANWGKAFPQPLCWAAQ